MSANKRYSLYAIVANTDQIAGITSQQMMLDPVVEGAPSSGAVHPSVKSLHGQSPRVLLTTKEIGAALDVTTQLGWAATGAGLLLYAYKHAEGGTRAGASLHRKYTVNEGMLVPRTLSAPQGVDATLGLEAIVGYDGSNDPVVITELQSVPALTDSQRFTMGPVELGGVTLANLTSFEIDFALQVETKIADGDLWPTYISVVTAMPRIRLRGFDPTWFADSGGFPLEGGAAAHANTTLYLRKRQSGGTFVSDVTAEHIKITAAGLVYIDTAMDADGDEALETELVVDTLHDGSNNPLVIDTTSAIT